MLPELDEAILEVGLEAIVFADEIKINKDMDVQQINVGRGSVGNPHSTQAITQATQYTAIAETRQPVDLRSVFAHDDSTPKTLDVTITGITKPDEVVLENALVTSYEQAPGEQEIELVAEDLTVRQLW